MTTLVIKARKKKTVKERTHQSISLPIELYKEIDKLSKETNVPKTELAVKLLKFGLKNIEVEQN